MEEYAVLTDHKKAIEYRKEQAINGLGKFIIDAEELAYWRWIYNEEIKELEPESDEPF